MPAPALSLLLRTARRAAGPPADARTDGPLPDRSIAPADAAAFTEPARRLAVSEGSVKGCLERGRAVLKDRLTRRGVAAVAGATVAVPVAVQEAVARTAVQVLTGAGAATLTPAVARLAEGVFRVT